MGTVMPARKEVGSTSVNVCTGVNVWVNVARLPVCLEQQASWPLSPGWGRQTVTHACYQGFSFMGTRVPTTGMLVTLWCHVRGGRHVSQIGGGSLVAGTQACVWGVFMCRATPSIIKIISIINYHNHPNTSVKCSPHTSQCHVLGSSKELPADRTGKFLFKLYMYKITMASLF